MFQPTVGTNRGYYEQLIVFRGMFHPQKNIHVLRQFRAFFVFLRTPKLSSQSPKLYFYIMLVNLLVIRDFVTTKIQFFAFCDFFYEVTENVATLPDKTSNVRKC